MRKRTSSDYDDPIFEWYNEHSSDSSPPDGKERAEKRKRLRLSGEQKE